MHSSRILVSLITAALFTVACRDTVVDNSDQMTPPPQEEISFADDVLPIFGASCSGSGCHVGERTNGVRLDSYEQVTSSVGLQYGSPIVEPGNAADSPIIDKITPNPQFGVRMPFGRAPLSALQIDLIRTWIDDGADDN